MSFWILFFKKKKSSSAVAQILKIVDIKVSVNSPWFESLRSLGSIGKESKDIICQKVYLKLNAELLKPWPFSSLVFGLVTQIQTLVQGFPSWSLLYYFSLFCSPEKDCSLNRKKAFTSHKFISLLKNEYNLRSNFFHLFLPYYFCYIIGSSIYMCMIHTHFHIHTQKYM